MARFETKSFRNTLYRSGEEQLPAAGRGRRVRAEGCCCAAAVLHTHTGSPHACVCPSPGDSGATSALGLWAAVRTQAMRRTADPCLFPSSKNSCWTSHPHWGQEVSGPPSPCTRCCRYSVVLVLVFWQRCGAGDAPESEHARPVLSKAPNFQPHVSLAVPSRG